VETQRAAIPESVGTTAPRFHDFARYLERIRLSLSLKGIANSTHSHLRYPTILLSIHDFVHKEPVYLRRNIAGGNTKRLSLSNP
jgi:hypothetical protein